MKRIIFALSMIIMSSHATTVIRQQRSIPSIINELKEQRVLYINFLFTDILGNIKEITVPISHALQACIEGLTIDGSSIAGCRTITASDMLLVPDITTVRIVPWLEGNNKTAVMLCDIFSDEQTPFEGDSRSILKQQVAQASQRGYEIYLGPELEFFLLTHDLQPIDARDYCQAETNIARHMQKTTMIHMLSGMNINVEKLHHEVATGQYEIALHYNTPREVADQLILAKYTLKSVAHEYGFEVSFMPKPVTGQNGSGMHIHFSVWDARQNRNLFHDATTPSAISYFGQQFIAGVLAHVNECCLLYNQTINSFKRLVPGYEAPIYICWGPKNRSALVRIPQAVHAKSKRAELRNPDAACNPYLAFSALIASGLKGVALEYEPIEPVTDNLYKISSAERNERGIKGLPQCLPHAIHMFEHSDFIRELLSPTTVETLVALKQKEVSLYQAHISSWELAYYNR